MQIPLVDLRAQYQTVKHEVMAAVEEVFDSMHLFLIGSVKEQTFGCVGQSEAL